MMRNCSIRSLQTHSTEAEEQKALVYWAFHVRPDIYEHMFAIPNGGSRHILEAKNLKLQGVKKGIPDIFIAIPKNNFSGLFVEMKRIGLPARVSKEQAEWIARLKLAGYQAVVCYGWQQAAEEILNYMKEGN